MVSPDDKQESFPEKKKEKEKKNINSWFVGNINYGPCL